MKFKENAIKPGMVIHCPKEEDARVLLEHLDSLGYIWCNGANICAAYSRWHEHCDRTGYQILGDREGKITNGGVNNYLCKITEFSDLIEPDENLTNKANNLANQQDNQMSAVEVLEWLKEHCGSYDMIDAFGRDKYDGAYELSELIKDFSPQEIISKITAYEAEKKAPKPVEVEWADVARIIKIGDFGRSVCVCERDIIGATDDNLVKQGVETALRDYIAEHEGEYFAVYQKQCRVKEGK